MNKLITKIDREGYVIIPNILSKEKCDILYKKIEKIYSKNRSNNYNFHQYGQQSVRDLILIDPKTFLPIISQKTILSLIKNIFNDIFILDNSMASNSVKVGKNYNTKPHIDSHLPSNTLENTTDVVVMYCINDFYKENGSTILWKGSHKSGIRIQNKPNSIKKKNYKKIYLNAKRGSAIICLGQIWHQVGKNLNGQKRWSIINHYKRWWMKPATDFTFCGKKIFSTLNADQKELLGFNSKSPKYDLKSGDRRYYTLTDKKKIPKNYISARDLK